MIEELAYSDIPAEITAKFEILEQLGEGGMGTVYKVRHRHLDDIQVIKILRAHLATDSAARERFLREARFAKQLSHPHISRLIDFNVTNDGIAYIVTEFIEGRDLRQVLRECPGGLPHESVTRIGVQLLSALAAIHDKGYVHRDMSPDNVIVSADLERPVAKLIDLGLAKSIAERNGITVAGSFAGKVHYASPEQFGGHDGRAKVDCRSDIYSLGVVLYELLTGTQPIAGASYASVVAGHLNRLPRQFTETDPRNRVPAALRQVVMKALEKEPAARYQTANEFTNALAAADRGEEAHANTIEQRSHPPRPIPSTYIESRPSQSRSARPIPIAARFAPVRLWVERFLARLAPTVRRSMRSKRVVFGAAGVVAMAFLVVGVLLAIRRMNTERESASSAAELPPIVASVTQPADHVAASATLVQPTPEPIPQAQVPIAPDTSSPAFESAPATKTEVPAKPPAQTKASRRQRNAPVVAAATPVLPDPIVAIPPPPVPPPPPPRVETYIEGGDRASNATALAYLQENAEKTSTIAVAGSGDVDNLRQSLSSNLAGVRLVDGSADLMIEYTGQIERLGRVRKRRSASATISKNGHPIFRYELPAQVFMIGSAPSEEFARLLRRALKR